MHTDNRATYLPAAADRAARLGFQLRDVDERQSRWVALIWTGQSWSCASWTRWPTLASGSRRAHDHIQDVALAVHRHAGAASWTTLAKSWMIVPHLLAAARSSERNA